MARTLGLLGLVMTLFLPCAVGAQGDDQNQMLSMTGRVSADQKTAAQFGLSGISIGFTGASPDKFVWVGVVKAESWNDDVFAGCGVPLVSVQLTPLISPDTPSV